MCCKCEPKKKTKQNRKYQPKKKQNTRQITKNGTKMLMLDRFFLKKKCTSKCLICRLNKWRLNTFSH